MTDVLDIADLPDYVQQGPPQGQWTLAHVQTFPADDGYRYEIIDGDLIMTTQPHWEHQLVAARLIGALQYWSDQTEAGWVFVEPGVIFADDTAVAPDIVWVRQDRLRTLLDEDGKLHGVPDLVVEILSPGKTNEVRDRETKLHLYRQHNVPEYWIVDPEQRQVEVYRTLDGELDLDQVYTPLEMLTAPLLPGFAYAVGRLFR